MATLETEDSRIHEIYMKNEEYDKMRKQLTEIEGLFTKVKDGIFYYPRALHPMAVASKELKEAMEQLFPRDYCYAGVTTIFSTVFTELIATYNDTVTILITIGKGW